MDDAKRLWQWWQLLLNVFQPIFTQPGWVRFVQWVTGTVFCWEEHTITQILVSLGLESRWRVVEHFAEYGAWNRPAVEQRLVRLIEEQRPLKWEGYRVIAVDDTKLHRTSENVWGTCTFHEPAGRSPNRASTVRAHNWVEAGDLIPGRPWTYLPHSSRLYFRKSQLPAGETFRKKTELAPELLRQADAESIAPILGVFDGAYANETVITPCVFPDEGQRRIEIVTRLRFDARLYHRLVPNPQGRPRKWGRRIAAPQHHTKWKDAAWQQGEAFLYGRRRKFRYKQIRCHWHVTGATEPVHVFVFEVEGYTEPWFIVTTALDLSAEKVLEIFCARFRQEDGFRDHKQRLGMEECRAWTKEPILRTYQVQLVAMTLLRLIQPQLDRAHGDGQWWLKPEWNRRKRHPSLLDLRRLFWRYRNDFSHFLCELENIEKLSPRNGPRQKQVAKAA